MARLPLITIVLLMFAALCCAQRGPDQRRREEGHHHRHQHHQHEPGRGIGSAELEKRLEHHETHFQELQRSFNHLEKYVAAMSDYMRGKFGEDTPQYVPLQEGLPCKDDEPHCKQVPEDCSKVKETQPSARSGAYTIRPRGASSAFKVHCSFEASGAWTEFQHRFDGSVSFEKKWIDYKNGFGSPEGEHWLGLEKIYALTHQGGNGYMLRIEVEDFEGEKRYAEYSTFHVDSERDGYALHVGAYSGDAGDSFKGDRPGEDQNGHKFTTIDRDNDGCKPCIFGDIAVDSCSRVNTQTGWWYSNCGAADLNGDWHAKGHNIGWASMVRWRTFAKVAPYSLKSSIMKIKARSI